jgi:hypothetical protein
MMNFLKRLFTRTKRIEPRDTAKASAELRNMVLHINPDSLGIKPSENTPNVWGVLMEFWLNQAIVTVVSLADGTTSMYFSSGGCIVGSGTTPDPAAASRQLIRVAEQFLPVIPETVACPMPKQRNVRFHLLTFTGYHSIELAESEIENKNHQLFRLYAYGQDVISKIRIHTEKHAK